MLPSYFETAFSIEAGIQKNNQEGIMNILMKPRIYCLLYFAVHLLSSLYLINGGENIFIGLLAFIWIYVVGSFTGVFFFFGLILGVNPFDIMEGC